MSKTKDVRTFMGDFETTVYEGQEYTEVWASASVELHTEDVQIFHSIDEQFAYFQKLGTNVVVYYHNLKFDGTFIISWLLDNGYEQGYSELTFENEIKAYKWEKKMRNNQFQYMISDRGMWYTIRIKKYNKIIEIRDSLKLLPFSVKEIGQAFKTKHQKLDMEYTGFRYAGCKITDEERKYIANDVLVVKEALEIMFAQGNTRLTIGSNCLEEFKSGFPKDYYEELFPDVYEVNLPLGYDNATAGSYILKSYKGGWCYLVEGKENKVYRNGLTADVNSLYPSMMHSESGNEYPVGYPTFWKGNYIPEEALQEHRYFFVRLKTRFRIKGGYLPFIQIKGSWFYEPNQCLKTSDFYDPVTGEYYTHREDQFGNIVDSSVILTLTMTDYYLFLEHYDTMDLEILDGCFFYAMSGIFDKYIDKYKKIKMESKGALRTLAKLMLNNLYGKMASTKNSSFKVCYLKPDGSIGFIDQSEEDKKPGYIPIGSAITSYARNFTIRTAQKNYHGVNERGFIYADTDSIHCDLEPEELVDVPVHPTDFCHWKLESSWDKAIFVRQKTYVEHIIKEDLEECTPKYSLKCAGMPEKCKELFIDSMTGRFRDVKYSLDDLRFLLKEHDLTDFQRGLVVPGKLMPKRIKGGTLLVETNYEMR